MAYQTGTATNPNDILDALRAFAVAQGWAELRWQQDGSGYTLSLTKGSIYVHLRSANNEALSSRYTQAVTGIWAIGSTGFDASKPWWQQPGAIINGYYTANTGVECVEVVGLLEVSTANTYHLMSADSPDQLVCVVEVQPGVYHHIAFGTLAKSGAYTGGFFLTGSYGATAPTTTANDYVFGDQFDSNYHLPFNDSKDFGGSFVLTPSGWASVCRFNPLTSLHAASIWHGSGDERLGHVWREYAPNTMNNETPMVPFYVFLVREYDRLSPLGYTPHMRYLNIANFAPGDDLVLGADHWRVFPAHSKGVHSGNDGFAVRYEL